MIEGSLSRRYAKALFQLALEAKREEEIGQEIERFNSIYLATELRLVLTNPAFSAENRKNVLTQIARSLKLSPLVANSVAFLLERDRLPYLPSIISRYRRLLDEKNGRVEAKLVAAGPVEENDIKRLSAALEKVSGKQVVLGQENDPSIVAGVVIHLEGKVYDGSVRTQLEKMKERIERGY
jgi:F-type H+-transporting ATPase subunit delta